MYLCTFKRHSTSMFYQLRFIFLFFFLELALISHAYGYQESTKRPDTSTIENTAQQLWMPSTLADQRDFREVIEPSETNETSQEDKQHPSGILLYNCHWGTIVNADNRYKNLRDFHRKCIHELPLFVLFHSWKFHLRFI